MTDRGYVLLDDCFDTPSTPLLAGATLMLRADGTSLLTIDLPPEQTERLLTQMIQAGAVPVTSAQPRALRLA